MADPMGDVPAGIVGPDGGPAWLPPQYIGIPTGPPTSTIPPPADVGPLFYPPFHHIAANTTLPPLYPFSEQPPSAGFSGQTQHNQEKGKGREKDGKKSRTTSPHRELYLMQLREQERKEKHLQKKWDRMQEEEQRRQAVFDKEQVEWRKREAEQYKRAIEKEYLAEKAEREYRQKLQDLQDLALCYQTVHQDQRREYVRPSSQKRPSRHITIDSIDGNQSVVGDRIVNISVRSPCAVCHTPVVVQNRVLPDGLAESEEMDRFRILVKDEDMRMTRNKVTCDICQNKILQTDVSEREKARKERSRENLRTSLQMPGTFPNHDKPFTYQCIVDETPFDKLANLHLNSKNLPSQSMMLNTKVRHMPVVFTETPYGTDVSIRIPRKHLKSTPESKTKVEIPPRQLSMKTSGLPSIAENAHDDTKVYMNYREGKIANGDEHDAQTVFTIESLDAGQQVRPSACYNMDRPRTVNNIVTDDHAGIFKFNKSRGNQD